MSLFICTFENKVKCYSCQIDYKDIVTAVIPNYK